MIYLPLKLTGINPLTLFNHHPKHASTEEYRGIMIVLLRYVLATGNKITTLGDNLFGDGVPSKLIYKK